MAAVIIAMMLAIGVLSEGFYARTNADRMAQAFGDGPTVSSAQQEAMQALAEMTRPDGRVMNDPNDR